MNKQPDTSTTAGKIEVMQACINGQRIQSSSTPVLDFHNNSSPAWTWDAHTYRIHPDDLNPPRKLREVWVNEYPEGLSSATHKTQGESESGAVLGCIGHVLLREVPQTECEFSVSSTKTIPFSDVAQKATTYRPWKPEEVPVGKIVMSKEKGLARREVLTSTSWNPLALLRYWTLEDGSPCGTKE